MILLLSNWFVTLRVTDLENLSLVISELLPLFVKTLTADGKYSLCKNFPQPIQMQLSKKAKKFWQ